LQKMQSMRQKLRNRSNFIGGRTQLRHSVPV
jgi:hypothetical protein